MRTLLFLFSALAVFGFAFWAYQENYATQQALKETRQLHRDIAEARVRLGVLKAEWSYLNRPDRLRDLADLNFERLGLLPLRPDQFGRVDEVAFPPDRLVISEGIAVSSLGIAESGETRP